MRSLYILLVLVLIPTLATAHNYYFGFAEMEYNANTQKLETTLILSAHDLEDLWMDQQKISKSLAKTTKDEQVIQLVATELLKDFSVVVDGKSVDFTSIGYEIKKNGLIHVYFESKTLAKPTQALEIKFSCMMEAFPAQQNKITYTQDKQKFTEVFLPAKSTVILKLD